MYLQKFSLYFILTLICNSCISSKHIDRPTVKKLTYISSQQFSEEGEDNLRSIWSEMINSNAQCDSAAYNKMLNFDIVGSFKKLGNDTIHIYNRRDSIYKVSRIDTTLFIADGNILRHSNKINHHVRYDTITTMDYDFKYTIYPDSIKNVLGYPCIKIEIVHEEQPYETLSLGNEITEMWVTNQISLPPQLILNPYPDIDLFPLIIVSYSEKLKGMETVVECISIE